MYSENNIFENDGKPIKCKELKAVHKKENGSLRSPVTQSFSYKEYTIIINQIDTREIIIHSELFTNAEELFVIHQNVENILMIMEGFFVPLESIIFDDNSTNVLKELSEKCINDRLRCYYSADYCKYRNHVFLDFETYINGAVFEKWLELREEAGLMHQVFLYNMAEGTSPIDSKVAFLIEMSEPLVELVKEHTVNCASLTPGNRDTSLKVCVDSLIINYGKDIFKRELNNKNTYDNFLEKTVKTRVRIMHIKKNVKQGYYSGKEYLLYVLKFSFLYRHIMLSLLGIPYEDYVTSLMSVVDKWDKWLDS